ncbi:hypothetical protein AAG570_008846 [Ranatra chinensis]|uniref:Uncharacterized protein n=1 Tax=Ranatra chinensis TaxID=642074 RepID=A0ABD0YU87_9HEMI
MRSRSSYVDYQNAPPLKLAPASRCPFPTYRCCDGQGNVVVCRVLVWVGGMSASCFTPADIVRKPTAGRSGRHAVLSRPQEVGSNNLHVTKVIQKRRDVVETPQHRIAGECTGAIDSDERGARVGAGWKEVHKQVISSMRKRRWAFNSCLHVSWTRPKRHFHLASALMVEDVVTQKKRHRKLQVVCSKYDSASPGTDAVAQSTEGAWSKVVGSTRANCTIIY